MSRKRVDDETPAPETAKGKRSDPTEVALADVLGALRELDKPSKSRVVAAAIAYYSLPFEDDSVEE